MTQESGLFTKPLKTNYQYLYFNQSRPSGRLFSCDGLYDSWQKAKEVAGFCARMGEMGIKGGKNGGK